MTHKSIRLLGFAGSLRAASTNRALLRAASANAPEDVELTLFDRLGELPIFNPDLEDGPLPEPAADLRRAVLAADGLVFAVPEYAHGIPGGLKNALDWLVSGSEIPGKPVAFFHASPRSLASRAALAEVLSTMSTAVVAEATVTVPLLGLAPGAMAERLADPEVGAALRDGLSRFVRIVRQRRTA